MKSNRIYTAEDKLLEEDIIFFNFKNLQKYARHWCSELNRRHVGDYRFYQHSVETEQEIENVLALNHIILHIDDIDDNELTIFKNDLWN